MFSNRCGVSMLGGAFVALLLMSTLCAFGVISQNALLWAIMAGLPSGQIAFYLIWLLCLRNKGEA